VGLLLIPLDINGLDGNLQHRNYICKYEQHLFAHNIIDIYALQASSLTYSIYVCFSNLFSMTFQSTLAYSCSYFSLHKLLRRRSCSIMYESNHYLEAGTTVFLLSLECAPTHLHPPSIWHSHNGNLPILSLSLSSFCLAGKCFACIC
jgi:hypothetical protein